jgi:enoyl-CoA hydratase/carnithine racemase
LTFITTRPFLANQYGIAIMANALFDVPIGNSGKVTVTEPAPKVYLVTFASAPDNRLTTVSSVHITPLKNTNLTTTQPFVKALHLTLDILQTKFPPGVVITTSGLSKFYSNGLDLEHATSTPGFFTETLYGLWHRLLTYPMPTVALLNGHTFAGGLMVAMMHDYRIMNPHKGFLCLIELQLGVGLRPPMCSIFREKVKASTFRRMILEAVRFKVS